MEENQKYWLLRIEQTIYGPFETQKVVDLITKGRVSEIDEAALPRDRWYYVRDLQEFMRAVELQRKINSRKKAHDETKGSGSATSTEALANVADEKTRELKGLDVMTNTLPIPNISREELMAIGDSDRARPLYSHGNNSSSEFSSKSKFKKIAFLLLSLIVIGVGLSVAFQDKLIKVINDGRSALNSEKPLESWFNKDYEKAYELFKRTEVVQNEHPVKYAALILKKTKDFELAKPLLDKASAKEKKSNAWINLNAVTYLYENNLDEAETFLKSIDQSNGELSLESLFNLAVWHHLKEDWLQSRALFESVFAQKKKGELDGALLYMVDAWIQSLEKTRADSDEYLKVSYFINNIINSESLYRYDVSFMAFWLVQTNKVNPSVFTNLEDKFMSFDPEIVFNRVSSPYVYNFSGDRIESYCTSLTGYSKFIQLSCQLTAQRDSVDSIKLPEQPEDDSNMLALYSFIYDKRGDSFKANEFLIESFEKNDSKKNPLRFYVQARFCQVNGNYKCAAENWTRALDINAFAPTALVGISEAYLETGEAEKAQEFYKKSMQFSQDLVSYHKLNRRMRNRNKEG